LESTSQIHLNHQVDNAGAYTFNKSIVYVCGSGSDVTLSSDPQIVASVQSDFLTVQGVGSSVVLIDSCGLRLYSSVLRLDSGSLVTFIYNATDGLWCETSRMAPNFAPYGRF
jgi:hypothetical protein